MKNMFTKTLLCVAILVLSFAVMSVAFAAETTVSIDTITPNAATGEVVISGTIANPADAQESTIIVVPTGTSLATVTDEQIKYIDQATAQSGAFSYTFKLADTAASYDVYVGGTAVDAPDSDAIAFTGGGTTTKYTIAGSFTLLDGAKFDNATAVAGTVAGTVDANGAYKIEVEAGTYDVVIGRPGYMYKTYAATNVAADVDLGTIALIAGDLDNTSDVNSLDLSLLIGQYGMENTVDGFNAALDMNDDGVINAFDLSGLIGSYGSAYAD